MGRQRKNNGFTIIEAVLVLAIMGLMMMAIIGGASNRAEVQHYREATELLRDKIVSVFESTDSYVNSDEAVTNLPQCDASSRSRGESNVCFFIGNILTIGTDASNSVLIRHPLIGRVDADDVFTHIYVYDKNVQRDVIGWGHMVAKPGAGALSPYNNLHIAVFKNPATGQKYSSIIRGGVTAVPNLNPTNLVTTGIANLQVLDAANTPPKEMLFCLRGGRETASPLGVSLHKGAIGPSDVEVTDKNSTGVCSGKA